MKRDNDYIRLILLEIEAQSDWLILLSEELSLGEDERKLEYHMQLLCDAGLATQVSANGFRLTNAGHDYIDAIRNDGIWQRTKDGASKVGGMTLSMMKDLAVAYVKQEAAVKLGITL